MTPAQRRVIDAIRERGATQGPTYDGMSRVPAPALPLGHVIRCHSCGCSVSLDHEPDGRDCYWLQRERHDKRAFDR